MLEVIRQWKKRRNWGEETGLKKPAGKGQAVLFCRESDNVLGFVGHTISIATTQPCEDSYRQYIDAWVWL